MESLEKVLAPVGLKEHRRDYDRMSAVRRRKDVPLDEEKDRQEEEKNASELAGLVSRSRLGDVQAMEALYTQWKTPLFNLAYRYTFNTAVAEDLLQDIFVKAFTNLHQLTDDRAFVPWIYRIGVNTCLSFLRSRNASYQKRVLLNDVENVLADETSRSSDPGLAEALEKAVQKLPSGLKNVFLLHDVQGFLHEEIAQILKCSEGTSKSQLFKARARIREHLEAMKVL